MAIYRHKVSKVKMNLDELFREIEEAKKDPKFIKFLNQFIKETTQ